ncbi:MAG: class I SAM-dependent methyltransferase [Candidatus Levybacteria bacterium]|nr:class I SAM-dependent methyltransferase [Candidatus Levybacteria bacterium]
MVNISCAICGKNQQTKVLYPSTLKEENISAHTYSARRLPDKLHYRFLKCQRCGLIFSSPIFEQAKIINLYKESSCNYNDQIPYVTKTYLKLFERVRNSLSENPKVLEVGCGNGFFLNSLKKHGIDGVYGVEPSPEMVSKADKNIRLNIKTDVFRANQFPKNYFDVVCCFHTLDHMIDPNEFIRGAFSVLKKDGFAIIVVHDTEGLSVKIFGENSAIFDIEHVYLFNKETLKKIFSQNNFKIIEIFNLVNNYPLNYWIRMSGIPVFFKQIFSRVLNALNLSKVNLSLAGGNICLVARKLV